ncbi:Aminotransferase-like plant mobile domain family protein [Euphorbia peplus]|nr:Aminotransferase-like plant mobile domain family protein [Euphorbia peplus]
MENSLDTIVESRKELMMSPILRTAHFLKPCLSLNHQSISELPSLPVPSLPPNYDPENLPLTVNFHAWKCPSKDWKQWVQKMASLHAGTWKKSGIFEAILHSTYEFRINRDLILGVAERWLPDTNSFVFPWGEATVTLEDMLIAGYSVLGDPVFAPLETEESKAVQQALDRERKKLNRTPARKPYHNAWLNAFMDSGSEIEHEAFLSLWLSRFVLPTSKDVICDCVFPIAIYLARGTRIALAPAVLGSIYRDLTLLKQKIVSLTTLEADDKVDVTTYAPFQLVLVWVWERFVKLSPKANPVKNGEPRFSQWNNLTSHIKHVRSILDSPKDCFIWRPYCKIVENWEMPKFYGEHEHICLDSDVDKDILPFVMCLRVSKLVGLDSEYVEAYFPHRVAKQFGYDQDLPGFVSEGNATRENAWDCYISPVTGIECYIPSRVCEGEMTTRYLKWWDHSVSVQHQEKASEKTPKVSKLKEKGLQTSSSPPISSKSLKGKTSACELNVSKVSATDSKRTKESESSKIRIVKKAEGERSGLKISAQSSERTKKGEASKSPISKKAAGKLNRLKVSAEGSEMTKKGEASNSDMRKKAAGKLKGLNVSGKKV